MLLSFFRKKKIENEIRKTFLEIDAGNDETWKIPKIEIGGKNPGPTIVLTSGIHGDEVSGNIILLKFCDFFKKNNLKSGNIVAYVGVNQQGSKVLKREIPGTQEDLNRLFPGKDNGTVGERIAFTLSQDVISHNPDLVIDIHNDYFFSTPYFLIDSELVTDKATHKKTVEYGHKTRLMVIQERQDEDGKYEKSFSAFFMKNRVPAVTLEAGSDKVLVRKHVIKVYNALLNLVISEKMIKKVKTQKSQYPRKFRNKVLLDSNPTLVNKSGSIKYLAEPGNFVKRGELIAKIYDQFGDIIENIFSENEAFIVGHSEKTYVEKGEEIFWYAV